MKAIFKNKLLLIGILFGTFILIISLVNPNGFGIFLQKTNQNVLSVFSTYYLVIGMVIVITSFVILFIPFSKKKLGNHKPDYSFFSWIALLYSTGMGSGLLLRAVQEPIFYLNNPPIQTNKAEILSLQYTFFHWGLTPWAMYSLFGLIISYNLYIKKAPNLLFALVPNTKNKNLKNITIVFIVLITITGVIASLGLGSAQLIGGINHKFQINLGNYVQLITVVLIGIVATLSALTGIKRVIKYLANFDFTFSILLMLFIASFLNFSQFSSNFFSAIYQYILHFFEMSLSIGKYKTSESFTRDWTVFYWAFWLAWVPFTGIFIARISKGRTVKEYIIATILIPTLATFIWFSVFANNAYAIIANNNSSQFDNLYSSLFVFLEHFPLFEVTFIVALFLVLISIINSIDSAVFVLGMLSDKGKENPSNFHKLIWGIVITATALGVTAIGNNNLLEAISNFLIIMVLPFSFLYLYIIIVFFKKIIS